jgi:hypothetical protein
MLRESLDIYGSSLPEDHWKVGEARSLLGRCLGEMGRFEEAEPLLIEGYERIERKLGPRHRTTNQAIHRLIEFYEASGNPDAAARYRSEIRD